MELKTIEKIAHLSGNGHKTQISKKLKCCGPIPPENFLEKEDRLFIFEDLSLRG